MMKGWNEIHFTFLLSVSQFIEMIGREAFILHFVIFATLCNISFASCIMIVAVV